MAATNKTAIVREAKILLGPFALEEWPKQFGGAENFGRTMMRNIVEALELVGAQRFVRFDLCESTSTKFDDTCPNATGDFVTRVCLDTNPVGDMHWLPSGSIRVAAKNPTLEHLWHTEFLPKFRDTSTHFAFVLSLADMESAKTEAEKGFSCVAMRDFLAAKNFLPLKFFFSGEKPEEAKKEEVPQQESSSSATVSPQTPSIEPISPPELTQDQRLDALIAAGKTVYYSKEYINPVMQESTLRLEITRTYEKLVENQDEKGFVAIFVPTKKWHKEVCALWFASMAFSMSRPAWNDEKDKCFERKTAQGIYFLLHCFPNLPNLTVSLVEEMPR